VVTLAVVAEVAEVAVVAVVTPRLALNLTLDLDLNLGLNRTQYLIPSILPRPRKSVE
jgi:hypothetical protein